MRKVLTFAVLVFVPLLANATIPPCTINLGCNNIVSVPEPGALSLLLLGLAVIGGIKLRNKFRK